MDRSWSRLELHGRAGNTHDDHDDPGEREVAYPFTGSEGQGQHGDHASVARGHTEPAIRFIEVVRDVHDASVDRETALAHVHDSRVKSGWCRNKPTLVPLRVAL